MNLKKVWRTHVAESPALVRKGWNAVRCVARWNCFVLAAQTVQNDLLREEYFPVGRTALRFYVLRGYVRLHTELPSANFG